MTKAKLLDLIITNGIMIRQIPFTVKKSFRVNNIKEILNSDYVITDEILKSNITYEQFCNYQKKGVYINNTWENGNIMGKLATKIIPIKNGGKWLTKISKYNDTMIKWSLNDNLSDTLEESVKKLLKM